MKFVIFLIFVGIIAVGCDPVPTNTGEQPSKIGTPTPHKPGPLKKTE